MEHLLIMPQVFSESTIIVFCKDKKKNERAKKLFDLYKKNLEKKWSVLESPESKKVEVDFGKKFFYDETEEKNLKTPKFNTSLLKKRERSDKIENFDYTNEN